MSLKSFRSPSMPRRFNPVLWALGWLIFRGSGWRVEGKLPDEKRLLVIAAPHTSAWDYVIGMAVIQYVGVRISYLMKSEAFVWPMSIVYRALGGIPVQRFEKTDIIQQSADWLRAQDTAWLAMAPEGTRKKTEKWKTGFLRIAKAADVPILVVGIDARRKRIVADSLVYAEDDIAEQAAALKAYMEKTYIGFKPENQ